MILYPKTGFDPNRARKLCDKHFIVLVSPPDSAVVKVGYVAIYDETKQSLFVDEYRIQHARDGEGKPIEGFFVGGTRTCYPRETDVPYAINTKPATWGSRESAEDAFGRLMIGRTQTVNLHRAVHARETLWFDGPHRHRIGKMREGAKQMPNTAMCLARDEIVLLTPTTNLPPTPNRVRWFASPIDSCWSDGVPRDWEHSILIDQDDVEFLYD